MQRTLRAAFVVLATLGVSQAAPTVPPINGVVAIANMPALLALNPATVPAGGQIVLNEYNAGTARGGGRFVITTSVRGNPNGCTLFKLSTPGWYALRSDVRGAIHTDWCGAFSNSNADDTVALANAYATAANIGIGGASNGGEVYIDPGRILVTKNIAVPDGVWTTGAGIHSSYILFSGPAVTTGLTFTNHTTAAMVRNIAIVGTSGAVTGITATAANGSPGFSLDDIWVQNFARQAINFDNIYRITCRNAFIFASGDATHAQVEVEHGATFDWGPCFIENANPGALAGLRVNHSQSVGIHDGVIEETGLPILIGDKPESSSSIVEVSVVRMDLEAPGAGNPYISICSGWTGPAGYGCQHVTISNVNTGSEDSGSNIPCGVRAWNTANLYALGNHFILYQATAKAQYCLEGTGNRATVIDVNDIAAFNYPYITVNNIPQVDAVPYERWEMAGASHSLGQVCDPVSGAQPVWPGCSSFRISQGNATSVTNLLLASQTIGNVQGPSTVYITAADANTTLQHGATGMYHFVLTGSVPHHMAPEETCQFFYNTNTGNWNEIGCTAP